MKKLGRRLLCIGVLMGIFVIPIKGAESQGTTTVSYTPGRHYERVVLNIDVHGKGTVYDGTQSIREGMVVYTMLEEDEKTLHIEADKGHQVKQIRRYEGNSGKYVDITEQLIEGNLTIVMGKVDSRVEIEFQAKGGDVNTGDETNTNEMMMLAILSLMTIILRLLAKKQDTNEENI